MGLSLSGVLKEKTNAKIIWYLRESERKYSDILKHLKERDSGKVNYHLKKLVSEGLVKKNGLLYSLTGKGMEYALYVDSLQLKEKYPLPVVVVAVVKGDKILLAKRCREPCKGFWGLPGNEILYGESPLESAKTEIEKELGFEIFDEKIYGVYPTIYKESGSLVYHVVLLAVKAKVKQVPGAGKAVGKISEYKFFTKDQLKKLKIMPSNRQAIIDVFSRRKNILIQDIDGKL